MKKKTYKKQMEDNPFIFFTLVLGVLCLGLILWEPSISTEDEKQFAENAEIFAKAVKEEQLRYVWVIKDNVVCDLAQQDPEKRCQELSKQSLRYKIGKLFN